MQVSAYPGRTFSLKVTPRDQLNAITIDIATVYGRIDEVSITKNVHRAITYMPDPSSAVYSS